MTASPSSVEQVIPVQGSMAQPEKKPRRKFLFLRNGKAVTGLIILGIYLLLAVIGPWIAPYDPNASSNAYVEGPSAKHWLGTTHLGQDVFSQLLAGTRGVLLVGVTSAVIATVLAVLVGVASGYLGGAADESMSALSNVFLVVPALPLIIIVTSTFSEAGDIVVALVIGLTGWAWGARVLRAQTLSLRRRDYVDAARATGESTWRIIVFEIMPNLTAIIASGFVGTMIFAVMNTITLAFIGIGGAESWNWGTILYWAQSQQALAQGAWWWFVPAGLAIAILGTALSLVNFAIDEFVSPRLRSAGKTTVKTNTGRKVRMRVGFTPVLRHSPAPRTPPPPVDPMNPPSGRHAVRPEHLGNLQSGNGYPGTTQTGGNPSAPYRTGAGA